MTQKNAPSAKGARTKHEQVKRRAESRRIRRKAEGEPVLQARTPEQLEAAARNLLTRHHVLVTPATVRIAKIHEQMNDAIDALYETAVRGGREQRQVSAMVSAGKLAVATLNMLGLPGDELEDEEAAAAEAQAEETRAAKAAKRSSKGKPANADGADDDDELTRYE